MILLVILVTRTFFFYCSGAHRDLHSFPTRRSSDLGMVLGKWSNVYLPDTAEENNPWKLPRPLANLYNRPRSEEHTSELQSRVDLVCRLLLEKKKRKRKQGKYQRKRPRTDIMRRQKV